VLFLKLLLVPVFLLLISLAGKRWGAGVAGWLAGFPVVAGPILLFVAIDSGAEFAAHAAMMSLAAIFALATFGAVYARCCQRMSWPLSVVIALFAWFVAAESLMVVVHSLPVACAIAIVTLLFVPVMFPRIYIPEHRTTLPKMELVLRMLAGALLTGSVTALANRIGPASSGVLTLFPVMGMVLAVFTQRASGAQYAGALLRAMSLGLWAFVAFCLTLTLALPRIGIAGAFSVALLLATATHAVVRVLVLRTKLH
jgi:uncharacterized membrane protein (GlpM family)